MNITMNFTEAGWISPLNTRDNLVIHFMDNSSNFIISKDLVYLNEDFQTLSHQIPKQLDSNSDLLRENTELAYKVILGIEAISVILSPFNDRHIYKLLAMINNLQLVGHLPMLSVILPANVLIPF